MNRLRPNPLPVVQLRDALNSGTDALPDAELLERFAKYADHAAFEVLLRRHGPLVFGVCRRTLLNPADADDAFQATFLVFLRKAKTVRGERLGPWLYGVAWRVAQKARTRAARLAAYRTEGVDMIPAAEEGTPVPDWLPVLDAELAALPAKYREALVLCELQGASRADAARALGLREGTLSSRLSRGRDLLRKRLLKHGTLLPVGGLAALFSANGVGRGSVPLVLFATVSELAKPGAALGTVPVSAARLADEVLKSMFLTKLRVAGGALVALALVAVGLATAARPDEVPRAEPDEKAAPAPDRSVPAVRSAEPKPGGPKLADRDALQGLWTVEKLDLGRRVKGDEAKQVRDSLEKVQFLIAGDVWWALPGGPEGSVFVQQARLDPGKNPKWLGLRDPFSGSNDEEQQAIYELDGDVLRVCTFLHELRGRPAELTTELSAPNEPESVVLHLRRGKLPVPAGEKAIVGSWTGPPVTVKFTGGSYQHTPRAEILSSYLFLQLAQDPPVWVGGKYTVDTTKNPKWVDVELTVPLKKDEKVTKLYGSYEVVDGRLKMAFGTKRSTRPLEFKEAEGVFLFDLGPAPPELANVKPVEAPMPRVKSAGR